MPKFGEHVCPSCGEQQWSIADNAYVEIYGHCWSEDKKAWEAKTLSLEEFEIRETLAQDRGVNFLKSIR